MTFGTGKISNQYYNKYIIKNKNKGDKKIMTFIHSLVRKSDYMVVFATDDYDEYREFIFKHFPERSYEISGGYTVNLKSRNFVYNCTKLNKDLFDVE